ncbi:hypothetical protein O3M35_011038 [Rhynocoris fuscipes]|uniref:Uncharacterized protein n=1 Tax=Rhynocoris fuscipes TaxID=488301 RepID=A0AAW1D1K7_9HEMI
MEDSLDISLDHRLHIIIQDIIIDMQDNIHLIIIIHRIMQKRGFKIDLIQYLLRHIQWMESSIQLTVMEGQ